MLSRHTARRLGAWLLGSILGRGFSNIYRFRVVVEHRPLPGLQRNVRVVQLSDLHYGVFIGERTVRRWVQATLDARPDLIVITGDFLDSHFGERSDRRLLAELARLHAPLGIYAVYGNHDWNSLLTEARRDGFARRLADIGITAINNLGVQLRDDLYLCGVDDWWFGRQDPGSMLARYTGGAVLLLSHNPDYLPYVPTQVTLTLCGHTHGGQVKFPFLGPMKQASVHESAFLEGWVETEPVDQMPVQTTEEPHGGPTRRIQGYVTHGLGVTGLPFRLDCPAELTVFDFLPSKKT
jgi:predicted MPP superfamily phosphohydrolase